MAGGLRPADFFIRRAGAMPVAREKEEQFVISASRRTDVPAFYMDWFMEGLERGFFQVRNPFSGRLRQVSADPASVHTIALWSKDFSAFLAGRYGSRLLEAGFQLFFLFTLNSENRRLEPRIPPLAERLRQVPALFRLVPPAAVTWRFDPLCFYRVSDGPLSDNLGQFESIARRLGRWGIRRCVTSFLDFYPKVVRRAQRYPGLTLLDPPIEEKVRTLLEMERILERAGIELHVCCEREVLEQLPPAAGIQAGACISHALLESLYGGRLSGRRDQGQRLTQGCTCDESRDIGSYREHPCFHNCLFCYANPSPRVS